MIDYIERVKVHELIEKMADGYEYLEVPVKHLTDKINSIPAANVRPVVWGEWIDEHPDKPNDPRMRCSVCTCVEAPLVKWRFCPNCGADMREES